MAADFMGGRRDVASIGKRNAWHMPATGAARQNGRPEGDQSGALAAAYRWCMKLTSARRGGGDVDNRRAALGLDHDGSMS